MGDGHRHRGGSAVAGPRLGRRAGHRRSARAVLSVGAARQVSRDGRSSRRPRAAPTTAIARPRRFSRSARRRKPPAGVGCTTAPVSRSRPRQAAALEASGAPRADPLQGAGRADTLRRSRARIDHVRQRQHRRLRRPAIRSSSHLSPLGRRRRCRHGDHRHRPRRRSHLEHAQAGVALSKHSDGRRRGLRTCRSSWVPTRSG